MSKQPIYYEVDGDEEHCYGLDWFKDRINDGEEKIILQLAKINYGSGDGWCSVMGESMEKSDGNCGSICNDYKPRNKISGRCIHHKNTYSSTEKKLILTKKGLSDFHKEG